MLNLNLLRAKESLKTPPEGENLATLTQAVEKEKGPLSGRRGSEEEDPTQVASHIFMEAVTAMTMTMQTLAEAQRQMAAEQQKWRQDLQESRRKRLRRAKAEEEESSDSEEEMNKKNKSSAAAKERLKEQFRKEIEKEVELKMEKKAEDAKKFEKEMNWKIQQAVQKQRQSEQSRSIQPRRCVNSLMSQFCGNAGGETCAVTNQSQLSFLCRLIQIIHPVLITHAVLIRKFLRISRGKVGQLKSIQAGRKICQEIPQGFWNRRLRTFLRQLLNFVIVGQGHLLLSWKVSFCQKSNFMELSQVRLFSCQGTQSQQ